MVDIILSDHVKFQCRLPSSYVLLFDDYDDPFQRANRSDGGVAWPWRNFSRMIDHEDKGCETSWSRGQGVDHVDKKYHQRPFTWTRGPPKRPPNPIVENCPHDL